MGRGEGGSDELAPMALGPIDAAPPSAAHCKVPVTSSQPAGNARL